jgi:hypothetical protein
MTAKLAYALLAVIALSISCKHTEVARKETPQVEAGKHFAGTPTAAEVAADEETLKHILGTWQTADDPRWAHYHLLTLRPDGSFTTVNTNRPNAACEGTWFLERGFLLLVKSDAAPFDYYGFHRVRHVDDHHLVCGPGMSVAGELSFTK